MKKLITFFLAIAFLSSCTSSTKYGECVGINDAKNPKLIYRYDTTNIVLAIVFWETLFVPLVVVLNELQCPVDKVTSP